MRPYNFTTRWNLIIYWHRNFIFGGSHSSGPYADFLAVYTSLDGKQIDWII